MNRVYLLSALLFSFAAPAFKIDLQHQVVDIPARRNLYNQVEHLTTISAQPITGDTQTSLSLADFIFYTYILIAALLFFKSLYTLFEMIKHTKKAAVESNGLKIIYKYSGFVNCSFFNYVFINPANFSSGETRMLLQHEQVHAQQWHSADKLFLLLCKTVLWFNPLIYWYDSALEQAHEFEADAATLSTENPKTYAQLLIRMASNEKSNALTHNFGKHPVKERVFMLFAEKSKATSVLNYLLIIPVITGLISVFSVRFVAAYPLPASSFTLVLDAGHGGNDAGAIAGDITEKELSLALVKNIRSIARIKGLKVVNTRNDDSNITLKQRGGIKGDILLSVHYNTSDDQKKNGIEILSGIPPNSSGRSIIKELSLKLYQNFNQLDGIAAENLSREVTGSYLLEKSGKPAIMLELGYLSNANDKKFITDQKHQDDLANAIVNSVIAYRDSQTRQK